MPWSWKSWKCELHECECAWLELGALLEIHYLFNTPQIFQRMNLLYHGKLLFNVCCCWQCIPIFKCNIFPLTWASLPHLTVYNCNVLYLFCCNGAFPLQIKDSYKKKGAGCVTWCDSVQHGHNQTHPLPLHQQSCVSC